MEVVRRAWRTIGWLLVGLVIVESLIPGPIEVPIEQGDKLAHVAAYATLMFWFAQDGRRERRMLYAIAFGAMGVALEFAQRFTGYRTYDVADMLADAVGVAIAWAISPPRGPEIIPRLERLFLSFGRQPPERS